MSLITACLGRYYLVTGTIGVADVWSDGRLISEPFLMVSSAFIDTSFFVLGVSP